MKQTVLKSHKELKKIKFENTKGLSAEFLQNNGALSALSYGDYMLNLSQGHPLEGNIQNLYLRVFENEEIKIIPMIGPESSSAISVSDDTIQYKGAFEGVNYVCSFVLTKNDNVWFWQVDLEADGKECDVVYFQDKGIGAKGMIRNNEFYTSHYIDNHVFSTDIGYVICARQNQKQSTGFPYLVEGVLTGSDGYATDAIQFYGVSYKTTNIPEALIQEAMPDLKLQGEFSASIFKTKKINLEKGKTSSAVFFAAFNENHEKASSEADLKVIDEVKKVYEECKTVLDNIKTAKESQAEKTFFTSPEIFEANDLNEKDLETYFGASRQHIEKQDGELLSFFTEDKHVVLKAKEVILERPYGHIVRSGRNLSPSDGAICSTNYMYGCFNAQVAIGNTSFNQMISHPRSMLNLLKSNGQRVFVTLNEKRQLLGVPSAYEIGFADCRWIYKNDDAVIVVSVWAPLDEAVIRMSVESNVEAEFTIYNEISLGANEYDQGGTIEIDGTSAVLLPEKSSMTAGKYPESSYFINFCPQSVEAIGGAELVDSANGDGLPCVVMKTKKTKKTGVVLGGDIHSKKQADALKEKPLSVNTFEEETKATAAYFKSVLNNINISHEGEFSKTASKINDVLYWYLHNAIVHFSIPHGLEQYSGAAWGVRDVLQGPIELLLACGKSDAVKDILKTVFSHQFIENGDWPQWFMFDRFKAIQDQHSHGDIIVWPLKAVSEYIEYSNDFSILDEKVPYTKHGDAEKSFTEETYTIFEHMKFEIQSIKDSFVKGTNLPCYGGGDWDDTLQPANQDLKKNMVSSWTAAIAYQYLNKFANVCELYGEKEYSAEVRQMANDIKADYKTKIIQDGQVTGFVYVGDDGKVEPIIHKNDTRTGINYRLLPMTRCMIAELFTKEETEIHYKLIREKLRYPDGVRLMDKHAPYNGGVSRIFKRAEQAAYCGREVGLLYVHAHLRYIEAMCKIGDGEEAFLAAEQVNPILTQDTVPNAELRQSNAYFSSCDIDFIDRYHAQKDNAKMKTGEIASKGGWRIYSSGPGIYMHQIINNILGLRRKFGKVIIDPVIAPKLDGLKATFVYGDKEVSYIYLTGGKNTCGVQKIIVNGTEVSGEQIENPYRKGGLMLEGDTFEPLLKSGKNTVEITLG